MTNNTTFRTPAARYLGNVPLFDPAQGTTVREPLDEGPGWWAGGCSAMYDPLTEKFYLYYRLRKPRELGRGVDCRVAVSSDGVEFEDVWQATKEDIDTQSMEKACLMRAGEDLWRLYMSFVDDDGRWCIEMTQASSVDAFDPRDRTPILNADECGAEGVKDPVIYNIGGLLHMIVSYAPNPEVAESSDDMHGTGDVFNTGILKSHSGLATSGDGVNWSWQGDILSPPDSGWDQYCTRLNSVVYRDPVYVGFYDGSASVDENYEEKAGLCVSHDLRHWERITLDGPFVESPHATKTIRYIEVVALEDALHYFYEWTRPDGSHELRTNVVPL
ncbi:MAG: hypothetical protein R6V19_03075 [Armatimonadota bacterium]